MDRFLWVFPLGLVVVVLAVGVAITAGSRTVAAPSAVAAARRWAAEAYPGRLDPVRVRCGSDAQDSCAVTQRWCDVDTDGAIVPLCCDAASCRLRGPVAR
jgi:hypothetical protein